MSVVEYLNRINVSPRGIQLIQRKGYTLYDLLYQPLDDIDPWDRTLIQNTPPKLPSYSNFNSQTPVGSNLLKYSPESPRYTNFGTSPYGSNLLRNTISPGATTFSPSTLSSQQRVIGSNRGGKTGRKRKNRTRRYK